MPSLITIFREIPDPRNGNAQRHDLLDILTIALVASVCGAESCVDFAEFAGDRAGLSHLADDGSSEGVGPSGSLSFAGDGEFRSGSSQQVECEASEDGEVFGAVVGAVSGLIFVEGDVEHPVELVLDGPMRADGGGEAFGRETRRGEVVAGRGGGVVALRLDAGEGGEARHGGRARLGAVAEEPVD